MASVRRNRPTSLVVVVALLVPLLGRSPAGAQAPEGPGVVADRLVVKLAEEVGPDERAEVAESLGGETVAVLAPDTIVVAGNDLVAPAVAATTDVGGGVPDILWSEPDLVVRAAKLPDDGCYTGCDAAPSGQAELDAIGAPAAWDVTTGSAGVVVAVLDTPVDADHPDLAGKVDVGPSFTDPGRTCFDPDLAGHGTAVAGIVGAATDNATGVASVGWDTRVLAVSVLDQCGSGYVSEIGAGIEHAVAAGADVINLSLVGDSSRWLEEAVADARAAGVLVVAAAGNEGGSTPRYPAAYPWVIGVGATDNGGTVASNFSNRGSWVDLYAPGEDVATVTRGGGYGTRTGTSFAAPMVAATAALVLAHRPGLDVDDLERRLAWSAVGLDGRGLPVGWGRLDVARALLDPPASYRLATAGGTVSAFGEAADRGSVRGALAAPIVDAQAVAVGTGYWLAAADGGVFSFGDARFLGSMGGRALHRPVVGMAATPSGRGYWLVAADGGVFSFGDARFLGSMGGRPLQAPVVAMASAPSGAGYWMAAADGGIFTFGAVRFHGSGSGRVGSPVADLAVSRRGDGYWVVSTDGRVLALGNTVHAGGLEDDNGAPVVAVDADS